MLLRLWQDERPRTVLVAWDTLDVPTYRHTELEAYQSGRVFDAELLEQLDLLPAVVAAAGFGVAKEPGYEADDFLAAAVTREEEAGGDALVATSDRDAFQLVSPRTTVLQPVRGAAPARIGPAEVRERYGVDPAQVPDFIAFGGFPRRIPERAASERSGPQTAASTSRSRRCSPRPGGSGQADALRLPDMATVDRTAPLPPLPDVDPDWSAAARARARARRSGAQVPEAAT
jgi:DNA polymerase-1